MVSSILSKHTGHVGNSRSEGVGGGAGFVDIVAAVGGGPCCGVVETGEKGSFSIYPGKFSGDAGLRLLQDINWIDLINTTWQFSGFICELLEFVRNEQNQHV